MNTVNGIVLVAQIRDPNREHIVKSDVERLAPKVRRLRLEFPIFRNMLKRVKSLPTAENAVMNRLRMKSSRSANAITDDFEQRGANPRFQLECLFKNRLQANGNGDGLIISSDDAPGAS